MRALVLHSHGGPEVLTVEEIPEPVPGPEEILVDVRASAINRADVVQRQGFYSNPYPEKYEIPGLEFSGTVAAVGERVRLWQPGDRVMGLTAGGSHAERLATHERQVMRVPENIDLADAAAIPEVYLTAWDALVVQAGLTSGRWALVHAGASGVGTAAILMAKAIGARIAVTCSGGKVDACLALGADAAIDYGSEDFVEVTKDLTGGRGIDVILDVIAGDYVNRNIAALASQGTIVQVGAMGGGTIPVNVAAMMFKRARLIGTVLRARPIEEKIALTQRFIKEMLPLFETGDLKAVVDSRYPLSEMAAAHARMEANANVGKILIDLV